MNSFFEVAFRKLYSKLPFRRLRQHFAFFAITGLEHCFHVTMNIIMPHNSSGSQTLPE
jgi:heme/copper-type cytochrome/quinol oxidase subunit 3